MKNILLLSLVILFSLNSFSQSEDENVEKIKNENYKEAIEDVKKLILYDTDNSYLYYLRGFSYRKIENYFNAKKDYLKAIQLGYRFEGAYFDLASIYLKEGDYTKRNTKRMHANIQASIAVRPSALGVLVVTVLKMLTRTRNTVMSKAMRPGILSGGMRKLIQETLTNMAEGR